MGEQEVVHLPEFPLRPCGFGGLRRDLGVWVDVVEWQMPPHIAELAEVRQQFADDRLRLTAVRTFEVAVLDERDGSVGGTPYMVALDVDGNGQVDDRPRRADQGAELGLAREHPRDAEHDPGQRRGAECGAQYAELGLLQLDSAERERRDQQRHGEADAGDRAAADHRGPADGRPQAISAQPGDHPRRAHDPDWLAHHVADEDPERDR
jgi:hypothetical protein